MKITGGTKMKWKGWYHDCEAGHFGEIFYCEDEELHPGTEGQNAWGPFKTFSECKKDAIAFHRCDLDAARNAIKEIRALWKPKRKI
jgi:hypothetical protein